LQQPALKLIGGDEDRCICQRSPTQVAALIDTADGELLSQRRELAARLAEDRFNLLLVGRFSRGKSTLMNALLGSDSLPTGIVPITSVITTVRYGVAAKSS
jgi:predicted GTPase